MALSVPHTYAEKFDSKVMKQVNYYSSNNLLSVLILGYLLSKARTAYTLFCYWLRVTKIFRLNFISIFQVFWRCFCTVIFHVVLFFMSTNSNIQCHKKYYMILIRIIIAHPRIQENYLVFDKRLWIAFKECN